MAVVLSEQTTPLSDLSSTRAGTLQHENLITDLLLTKALEAILQVTDAAGQIQARQIRERAGFTLTEAIQAVRYLHRQGVLGEEVDGRRVVNRDQALDYLSILAPLEAPAPAASKETHPFSQAQIAWACVHARDNKLTVMRIARPSRWTIALAQALGLVSSGTPGELIFTTGQAKRLCSVVEKMSESERASHVTMAESRLAAKEH